MKKKHICIIVPSPKVRGGIATVVDGYYGSKLEEDYKVTYIESYTDKNKLFKLLKGIKAWIDFAYLIRKDKPDLVHIHSSFGPSFYRKMPIINMAYKHNIAIVNHIHGSAIDEFYFKASDKKKNLVRKVYGKCDIIITLAKKWQEDILKIVPDKKVLVVPNYTELKEKVPATESLYSHTILFFGVITKEKGCYIIPEVMKRVIEVDDKASCIICGEGDIDIIKDFASKLGILDRIEFPGWVRGDKKDEIFRRGRILFLPSHMEAMPMTILEGMSYGLPIVSTNVGGIPSIVENGENGILCDIDDVRSMSDAIIHYLTDSADWKKVSKANLKKVKDEYTLEKHIKRVEAIYSELI